MQSIRPVDGESFVTYSYQYPKTIVSESESPVLVIIGGHPLGQREPNKSELRLSFLIYLTICVDPGDHRSILVHQHRCQSNFSLAVSLEITGRSWSTSTDVRNPPANRGVIFRAGQRSSLCAKGQRSDLCARSLSISTDPNLVLSQQTTDPGSKWRCDSLRYVQVRGQRSDLCARSLSISTDPNLVLSQQTTDPGSKWRCDSLRYVQVRGQICVVGLGPSVEIRAC
ncbi:hypothetical protein RRG08_015521 [Elysia crispata]|uniref:Uncharacterized protein n=1 Tax=Elysia crispata TaxID=231223 RepID=A0AAE0YIN8_9GAST|nr:hypothetical protein RRG08_015521 [Elysia crispata]